MATTILEPALMGAPLSPDAPHLQRGLPTHGKPLPSRMMILGSRGVTKKMHAGENKRESKATPGMGDSDVSVHLLGYLHC